MCAKADNDEICVICQDDTNEALVKPRIRRDISQLPKFENPFTVLYAYADEDRQLLLRRHIYGTMTAKILIFARSKNIGYDYHMKFYPDYCSGSRGSFGLAYMVCFLKNRLETRKYHLVLIAKEDIPNAYSPSTGTGSFRIGFIKANNHCGPTRCYIKAVDKRAPTGREFNTPGVNFGQHKLSLLTTAQMKDLWADGLGRLGTRKNGSYYGKLKWKVGCVNNKLIWLYAFDSANSTPQPPLPCSTADLGRNGVRWGPWNCGGEGSTCCQQSWCCHWNSNRGCKDFCNSNKPVNPDSTDWCRDTGPYSPDGLDCFMALN